MSAEYKVILPVPLLCFLCTNAPFDSLVFKVFMCKSVFVDLNSIAFMLQAVAGNSVYACNIVINAMTAKWIML